jgi:phage recombination protein Bet
MTALVTQQAAKLATLFNIPESSDLVAVLKATAFKGQVSDAQMSALLIVANQYNLNPWTKEIYAFPDKNNGIVPVVGVDGWSRIINENPQFDGMDFEQDEESCTCVIHRKDRSHPIKVTEYMSECKRPAGPWQSHPKRMLRHKAMIQCARLAFGYVGIYDQDEAERIVDVNDRPTRQTAATVASQAQAEAEDVLDSETRERLLADLGAVADTGTEALQASWMKLQKHERIALAGELDALKDRASKVINV